MSPLEAVVVCLFDAGFVEAGETREETVRISTGRSPILGRTGGERRTFGGRLRMELPGTDVRATVGPRTTYLYHCTDGHVTTIATLRTKDLDELSQQLARLEKRPPA